MYSFDAEINHEVTLNGVVYSIVGVAEFETDEDTSPVFVSFNGAVYEPENGDEVPVTPELLKAFAADVEGSDWLCDCADRFWEDRANDYEERD